MFRMELDTKITNLNAVRCHIYGDLSARERQSWGPKLINKQIDLSSLVLICFLNDYFGALVDKKEATKPFQGTFSCIFYLQPNRINYSYLKNGFVLCMIPSLVLSFSLVKRIDQSSGSPSGSAAKPWF